MNALIVYSGGLDSTVLLNDYKDSIKLALSFNYRSKHNGIELRFAYENAKDLDIEHEIIELPFIKSLFKSSLLQADKDIPSEKYRKNNMRSTVVPFRNGIMLSIAIGLAESNGFDTVLIANHAGDHAIYPDCTEKFIKSFNIAAKTGTYNNVSILSPYCLKSKKEIAQIGKQLDIDFSKTYSCYNGKEIHCGVCATCIERKEALKGFDNTKYKE